jgi:ankyrin repeat protein
MRNILIATMRRNEHEAVALLQIFLKGGVKVNARYKMDGGQSALHFATTHGLWDCARLLIAHRADPDMSFEVGMLRFFSTV